MFSKKTRQDNIDHMKQEELDLLIIGGGITGAGVAIQAAASGIKTGLIEMQDFAEGTSSRSTKLVHGGIRYLKTFDVEVVADTVGERAVVQQVAPHIPKPDPMLLPIYEGEGATTFNMLFENQQIPSAPCVFIFDVSTNFFRSSSSIAWLSERDYLLISSERPPRYPLLIETFSKK